MKSLVICGPSGSGKTSLLARLLQQMGEKFALCVSHTTRTKRQNETNGREYHFVSEVTFTTMIQKQEFIEWTHFADNYYGTSFQCLKETEKSGKHAILDLELRGVFKLRENQFNAKYVFIKPPNLAFLERNLKTRATETKESIERRLESAKRDLDLLERNEKIFDLILINECLEIAFKQLKLFVSQEFQ